ncbi:uncharacterized protein BKCO1_400095 [Diplodia corticola]|uniref:DUF6536 domain-containing protein n=1 Tax=Diplodia corticola TaxID=236234 RepID=A0A1J9RDQ9_9PEZI|nr:uncharacterized protein BKCO1_400095 [Diplodia corticola]OJD38672.1 hypothetical protein BKCO1_400095 [Diplodia corticola]
MNEANPSMELLSVDPRSHAYEPSSRSSSSSGSSRGAKDEGSSLSFQDQGNSGPSDDDRDALLQNRSSSLRPHVKRPFAPLTRRLPSGWRFGVTVGAALSVCTLITNVVALAVTSSMADRAYGHQSSVATIRKGDCSEMEHLQLGIHLAINIVSTLLLGASNYCMQCLSAPTRADVDRAHRRATWLDIGVPSLKNFQFIRPIKILFWCLLALSSVPLHLLYNSTFFLSITNNSYEVYFATEDFQRDGWFDTHAFLSDDRSIAVATTNGTQGNVSGLYPYMPPYHIQSRIKDLGVSENGSFFERLENADCIQEYAKTPLHDRRNLVLVTSTLPRENQQMDMVVEDSYMPDSNLSSKCESNSSLPIVSIDDRLVSCADNSTLLSISPYTSYTVASSSDGYSVTNWFNWMCSQNSSYTWDESRHISLCKDGYWQQVRSNASEWTVWGFKIDYCISEKMENGCALNVAKNLLIVVIVFNAVKSVVLITVALKITDSPLITIGDAAASFIRDRDPTTRGMCLLTKADFSQPSTKAARLSRKPLPPRVYEPGRKRKGLAAGKTRWALAGTLYLICLTAVLGLLGYGVQQLKTKYDRGDFASLWELGLGTAGPYNLITGWRLPSSGDAAIVSTVLIANLPQALLSAVYFLANALVTNLSLAAEWSRYAARRAALRVSHPARGSAQRSTYFLQIPYRLALPLALFSSLLHWLVSQSIFIVKVDGADPAGGTDPWHVASSASGSDAVSTVTCGYSPVGMMATALAAVLLVAFAAALGARRLAPGVPLAGSCSAAIAAACHAPEGADEARPLMWGVVPGVEFDGQQTSTGGGGHDAVKVGHCALSDGPVDMPVAGNMYA